MAYGCKKTELENEGSGKQVYHPACGQQVAGQSISFDNINLFLQNNLSNSPVPTVPAVKY